MRRAPLSLVPARTSAVLSLVVAAASLVVVTAGPVAAAPATAPTGDDRAQQVLRTALATLGQGVRAESAEGVADRDATLALRDLALVRDDLTGRDRARADSLLARPTDGTGPDGDRFGDGYTVAERTPTCGDDICVHSVASTPDRADLAQVERTLAVMEDVHDHHTGDLGYREPVADGTRGGDARFDVYLADVGADGLYGYCATDADRRTSRTLAGYCVLDNDFTGFPRNTPDDNLRVTAAHEYFHAIQYAYDAREDTWLLEATATWVEEQYADEVDDNRQYLKGGQLRSTRRSIDRFPTTSPGIYGNWIFAEHLANRFGVDVVRRIWERAVGPTTSVPAVAAVLASEGTDLRSAYSLFAADNTVPGRTAFYPEGGQWGVRAPMARSATLDRTGQGRTWDLRLDHLTSQTVAVRSRGLAAGHRLRVAVDAPAARTAPAAYVIVHRKAGGLVRRYVPLAGDGVRRVVLGFASAEVDRVTVTLVNGSAAADRAPFGLRVTAVR